ncbi:MAG: hypothetical protein IMF03_10050 [Proteobacteria bacterium]|nr:hypothetical protein [Pseudomonadota bacterium]
MAFGSPLFLNGSFRYKKEPFKAKITLEYGLYLYDINWLSWSDPIPCKNLTLYEAKNEWSTIIIASSFVEHLNLGLKDGIKNNEKITTARATFTQLMSAVRNANSREIDIFAEKICL